MAEHSLAKRLVTQPDLLQLQYATKSLLTMKQGVVDTSSEFTGTHYISHHAVEKDSPLDKCSTLIADGNLITLHSMTALRLVHYVVMIYVQSLFSSGFIIICAYNYIQVIESILDFLAINHK